MSNHLSGEKDDSNMNMIDKVRECEEAEYRYA